MCTKWIFFSHPWPKCVTQNNNREWNVFCWVSRRTAPSLFPWFSWEVCPKSSCFSLLPCSFLEMGRRASVDWPGTLSWWLFLRGKETSKEDEALFFSVRVTGWIPQQQLWAVWSRNSAAWGQCFLSQSCLGADCCHLTCRHHAFHLLRAKVRIQHWHHGILTFTRTHHPQTLMAS